jgi:hypothetical protein
MKGEDESGRRFFLPFLLGAIYPQLVSTVRPLLVIERFLWRRLVGGIFSFRDGQAKLDYFFRDVQANLDGLKGKHNPLVPTTPHEGSLTLHTRMATRGNRSQGNYVSMPILKNDGTIWKAQPPIKKKQ